jgi:hypothetical protein
MRRNFYELAAPGPAPIAGEALKHIAAFYAIEKDIRGRSAEERRTPNRLEYDHGFFVKSGDGSAEFKPIAGYAMARYLLAAVRKIDLAFWALNTPSLTPSSGRIPV